MLAGFSLPLLDSTNALSICRDTSPQLGQFSPYLPKLTTHAQTFKEIDSFAKGLLGCRKIATHTVQPGNSVL